MSSALNIVLPPFSSENALENNFQPYYSQLLGERKGIEIYLKTDLQTPKLKQIHGFLWLAGLLRDARPLHKQKLLTRKIYITESPDEHLVWHDASIFIKPLPRYLLNYQFWEQRLYAVDDATQALRKSACGLLLSYVWLIRHRSDLRIAIEEGLLPNDIQWEGWVEFVTDFTANVNESTLHEVDKRYEYGELRLSRINTLYHLGLAGLESQKLVRGFMSSSMRYTTFFERNFSWVLAVFIYITVVLSAMQVALGTEKFGHDVRFQKFSYGIALLSITFVLAAVAAILLVWWSLFWFHLISTTKYDKKIALRRQGVNQIMNVPEETPSGIELTSV